MAQSIMGVKPPLIASYSITTKCNLSCRHRDSEATEDSAPNELSTEKALRPSHMKPVVAYQAS
jgi:MoaA/NifB/PqqE/SkfB family radical SAM enzyme